MKKSFICLLAAMMVFGLCACDNGKATETPVVTESVQPEVTIEPTAEPTATPEAAEAPVVYLKDIYAKKGLKVGTCLTKAMLTDKTTEALIKEQFSSVTMENAMKPDYIFNQTKSQETGDLVVEFNSEMIYMLKWAKENDMAVRGHTLVWYSQTPTWIFREGFDKSGDYVSREVMLARMESYIKQVFEQLTELGYIDLFYAYDVVNEAWMEDGTIRSQMNPWKDIIGDDYLWYAFYYADKYAPESINLFYNDYNEQFKTGTLVKFVNTLKDEDGRSLIDGIGLQAHLYTSDDMDAYFRCVDTLAETGLIIEMTELDVSMGAYQKEELATAPNRKIQGQYYYNLIGGIFERIDNGTLKMDSLTYWGFSDGLSWRKSASPLLYNARLKPKEAYYGAAQIKEFAGFDE